LEVNLSTYRFIVSQTYQINGFSFERGMDAHEEWGGRGQNLDEVGRKKRNIDMALLEGIHERYEGAAPLREPRVTLGVKQDFVFSHNGTQQVENVTNSCKQHKPLAPC